MYVCKIRVSCGLKAAQGAMTHCTQNHYVGGGGRTHECLIIAFSEVDSSATLNTYLYWSMLSLYLPFLPCIHNIQCFTSIVGPNGSGKSNVIDAMLFVFGYRARKIRSKKISVLIHNSEHHQNITSCTVSVHFQKIIDLVRE